MEVLLAPLVGSPKFHTKFTPVPGEVLLANDTVIGPLQPRVGLSELNVTFGDDCTVTTMVAMSVHPPPPFMFRVTVKVPVAV